MSCWKLTNYSTLVNVCLTFSDWWKCLRYIQDENNLSRNKGRIRMPMKPLLTVTGKLWRVG